MYTVTAVYLMSSRFSGAIVFSCVLILVVLVCGSGECGCWVGNVLAAVIRAHNRPKKALSRSFAARWRAFPFLMLFAIGYDFLKAHMPYRSM